VLENARCGEPLFHEESERECGAVHAVSKFCKLILTILLPLFLLIKTYVLCKLLSPTIWQEFLCMR
jgi:hypothetical protein